MSHCKDLYNTCGIRGSQIVLVGKRNLVQMPSVPRLMIISLITTRDCHFAEEKQTILPIEKVFTMRTAAIDIADQHRLECNNCWAMVVAQEWSTLVEERVAWAIRSGTTCPRQQHWASLSLNNGLRPSAPGDCQVPPPLHPSTSCSNFVRN